MGLFDKNEICSIYRAYKNFLAVTTVAGSKICDGCSKKQSNQFN